MMSQSSHQLSLLGAPHLTVDGVRVALPRRKALALLAYLAATRTAHTRPALAALLWGDSDEASAQAYLRNALWTLSKALGAAWLSADGGTLALNPSAGLIVDVTLFSDLARRAQRAESSDRLALLTEAAGMYVGRFMDGFSLPDCPEFDQWQLVTAQGIERTAHGMFAGWVDALTQAGDLHAALSAAQRWVALDSLHEPAHRALMRLYADLGETPEALRQYRELSRLLREELRAQPDPTTTALYQHLSARTPTVAAAPTAPPLMPTALSPDAPPHNPFETPNVRRLTDPTFIFGREAECAAVLAHLSDPLVSLVTIVGAGGMGKTRLAEQVAADAHNAGLFPDGAYFVNLAPLCAADTIASTVAHALPFPIAPSPETERSLFNALRDRRVLLVIDNCEHVLEGVSLFSRLIEAAHGVKILATSRERLALRNERVYELHGLLAHADQTPDSPAVRLFALRAEQADPGFALTDDALKQIARIIRLVEGMPLGIELAAAWTPLLTPAHIADEIQRGIDFLAAPTRDVPERHRSLRAVFESSWGLMTVAEQNALAHLSVFRGDFTVESASAVADAGLPVLLALVRKSLIRRAAGGRFEMHELLRQFADGQLSAAARHHAHTRHARYIATWLDGLTPSLLGADQPAALDRIQADIDNIRAALRHAIQQADAEVLGKMLDPLGMLLSVSPRWDDFGDQFLKAAHALTAVDTPEHRLLIARLLIRAALVKRSYTHQSEIDNLCARAAGLLDAYADAPDAAQAWVDLGSLLRRSGAVDPRSEPFIRRSLALYQQRGHLWGIAFASYQLAVTIHMSVRYSEARALLLDALRQFESIGQPWGLVITLDMLSENAFTLGLYEEAYDALSRQLEPYQRLKLLHEMWLIREEMSDFYSRNARLASGEILAEVLRAARETGNRRAEAWALYNAGWVSWHDADYPAAMTRFREANHLFLTLGEDDGLIWTNIYMADTARLMGERATFAQHVANTRVNLAKNKFPWGEAGLEYVLGDADLAAGDIEAALTHYQAAVHAAHGVHAILQTLRHLSGVAAVWAQTDRLTDALTLCYAIVDNPSTWDDTLKRVRPMISSLEASLPPAQADHCHQAAAALSLDAAVALV